MRVCVVGRRQRDRSEYTIPANAECCLQPLARTLWSVVNACIDQQFLECCVADLIEFRGADVTLEIELACLWLGDCLQVYGCQCLIVFELAP